MEIHFCVDDAGTQEEAAEAYDIAAIKFRGLNAVTNFDMSRYDVKSILDSSTLPVGGAARRLKDAVDHVEAGGATIWRADMDGAVISQLADAGMGAYASYGAHHAWPTIAFQQPSPLTVHYPYGHAPPRGWCKPEQDAAVAAAAHSLQDLQQLHLGSAAHNFFQASSSSTVYNGGAAGYHQAGLGAGGAGSFLMPSSTVVADQGHSSTANQGSTCSYGDDQEGKLIGYDAMVATAGGDPYAAARSGYQFSQGSGSTMSIARANGYSNNWSSPFNGMG